VLTQKLPLQTPADAAGIAADNNQESISAIPPNPDNKRPVLQSHRGRDRSKSPSRSERRPDNRRDRGDPGPSRKPLLAGKRAGGNVPYKRWPDFVREQLSGATNLKGLMGIWNGHSWKFPMMRTAGCVTESEEQELRELWLMQKERLTPRTGTGTPLAGNESKH